MTTLKKATIEELETELLNRKIALESKEKQIEIKYEKMKPNAWGHCIIHWESGGSSLAVFGNFHSGERWFACSNWTCEDGTMKTTSLREYIVNIKRIEQIRKNP